MAETFFETCEATVNDQFANIPPLVRNALDRWATEHKPAGDFVMSVLRNDLHQAVCRADERSLAALRDIVLYVYNELPSKCWGSDVAVNEWLEKRKAD